MKIDAEYHELHCIRGAADTIRRWHPAILAETLDDVDALGSDLNTLADTLGRLGYSAYWFDGDRLRLRQPRERHQNLFFLSRQHAPAL
jgi:hypothetical protein